MTQDCETSPTAECRLAALEQRMAWARIGWYGLALFTCAVTIFVLQHTNGPWRAIVPSRSLRARSLVVETIVVQDTSGRPIAKIGQPDNGGSAILLFDQEGRRSVEIAVRDNGRPAIRLLAENGRRACELRLSEEELATLVVSNDDGEPCLWAGYLGGEQYGLAVIDENGKAIRTVPEQTAEERGTQERGTEPD